MLQVDVRIDAKLFMKTIASDSGKGPEGMVWQDTANTKMSCP